MSDGSLGVSWRVVFTRLAEIGGSYMLWSWTVEKQRWLAEQWNSWLSTS